MRLFKKVAARAKFAAFFKNIGIGTAPIEQTVDSAVSIFFYHADYNEVDKQTKRESIKWTTKR